MKILVDLNKCTGLGMCESIAPDHFEVLDCGTVAVLRPEVASDELTVLQEAVDACPTCAISLEN